MMQVAALTCRTIIKNRRISRRFYRLSYRRDGFRLRRFWRHFQRQPFHIAAFVQLLDGDFVAVQVEAVACNRHIAEPFAEEFPQRAVGVFFAQV